MFWAVSGHWSQHGFKNECHTYCTLLSRFYIISVNTGKGWCCQRGSLLLSPLPFFTHCRSVSCWDSHPYAGLTLHWRLRSLWPINYCGWIQIFSPDMLSAGHTWEWACTAVPHCLISHSNYMQRLGKFTDIFWYKNCPWKSGGHFPIGHKIFKEHGSQFGYNYCCAPLIESSVVLC